MSRPLLSRLVTGILGFRERDERRLFLDDSFYKRTYGDVAASGVDAFDHFMAHGWREGRNPSRYFNTLYYRDQHLGGAEVNPLTHFVETGQSSGLAPIPPSDDEFIRLQRTLIADIFDKEYYKCQISDIAQDMLTHYLTVGWREGKSPSPTFDVTKYYSEHLYVKALDISPFYHFVSQTRMRARRSFRASRATPAAPEMEISSAIVETEFDFLYYLRCNQDVKNANKDPLEHFLEYGWHEKRNPSALFNYSYYLAEYPDVAEANINAFFHYLAVGRDQGRRPNPVGYRLYPSMKAPSDNEWGEAIPAAATKDAEYIVIMPVYKGYDETLASIHAVLVAKQATKFALHVINDCTPDAALDDVLTGLAEKGLFSYSKNEINIGFVKSVNRGLRLFAHKEVILLNADTKVFCDWLDRINAHAKQHMGIATITPMSNNATICSYPLMNDNNLIEGECSAEELDRLAAVCNAGRVSDIPTGVGFCFYISRASRDEIGILDEKAFGRGYGEENDFCLRAAKAGFRNVLAENIFVYHAGQVSFAEFEAVEYSPGQKALLGKHPDFPTRIKQHLEADSSARGRMRLDLFRLAKDAAPNSMIFVYHGLTGGIIAHVKHMEERLREVGFTVIHIRVGVSDRWSVEIVSGSKTVPYCPNITPTAFNQIRPLIAEFFGWLKPKAIHFHSLVGFDWVATTGFLDMVTKSSIPYYFTLHDYSIVCHRNDLVTPDKRYCGLPDVSICQTCAGTDRSYPEALDPIVRRRTYDDFLKGAAGVFAPSKDIKKRLEAAGASFNILVRPHEEVFLDAPILRPPRKPNVIQVVAIGAIGPHKGSRVILNLARDARARSLPLSYHIIGYSDVTAEMSAAGVTETGRYRTEAEAIDLLKEIRPSCAFLPSIWPETFCFTLSMAFNLEIPPVVFDLGAQAARVRAADFGFVLPYKLIDNVQCLNDKLCELPYTTAFFDRRRYRNHLYENILDDYYSNIVHMLT